MRIPFATTNVHKVKEAHWVGKRFGISFEQVELAYPEVRSESVVEVAKEGASYVHRVLGKPVVVEDSGLYVEALKGFPGPYSAYVYGKLGVERLLKLLEGEQNRAAKFVSAVAYADETETRVFVGEVEGEISEVARGEKGFGFDPIFIPQGYEKTFAEDYELKLRVSHRTKAFEQLCKWLRS